MILYVNNSGRKNILSPRIGDAGFDLVADSEPKFCGNFIEYETGVRIEPDHNEGSNVHGFIFPRSSISKTNLVLANSVALIDNSYRGFISLRFRYLPDPEDFRINVLGNGLDWFIDPSKIYKKGDKIGQLLFLKTKGVEIETVDDEGFTETERGAGGFGSTGN